MNLSNWAARTKEPLKRELPNLTREEQQVLQDKLLWAYGALLAGATIGPTALYMMWEWSKKQFPVPAEREPISGFNR